MPGPSGRPRMSPHERDLLPPPRRLQEGGVNAAIPRLPPTRRWAARQAGRGTSQGRRREVLLCRGFRDAVWLKMTRARWAPHWRQSQRGDVLRGEEEEDAQWNQPKLGLGRCVINVTHGEGDQKEHFPIYEPRARGPRPPSRTLLPKRAPLWSAIQRDCAVNLGKYVHALAGKSALDCYVSQHRITFWALDPKARDFRPQASTRLARLRRLPPCLGGNRARKKSPRSFSFCVREVLDDQLEKGVAS